MSDNLPETRLTRRLTQEATQLTPAPEGLWERVEASRGKRVLLGRGFVLSLAATAVVIGLALLNARPTPSIWRMNGRLLSVGEALETRQFPIMLAAEGLGTVAVTRQSRIRIVESRQGQQRLALDRGEIEVKVTAPPRLFAVETPGALAIDLGCAYKLRVAGRSTALDVSVGWVELEDKREDKQGRAVLVPAGGHVTMAPSGKLSLPWYGKRLPELDAYESGGQLTPLLTALAEPVDTLTLFHLLPRVSGSERVAVLEKILTFTTLPGGVTREQVLALDNKALATWREELKLLWGGASQLGI